MIINPLGCLTSHSTKIFLAWLLFLLKCLCKRVQIRTNTFAKLFIPPLSPQCTVVSSNYQTAFVWLQVVVRLRGQQPGKAALLTRRGWGDSLEAASAALTLHWYANAVYPPLRVWFNIYSIYTCPRRGVYAECTRGPGASQLIPASPVWWLINDRQANTKNIRITPTRWRRD